MDGRVREALHVAHALERSGEFEIVHNQLDWLPLVFGAQWAAPMVTTIHGFSERRSCRRTNGGIRVRLDLGSDRSPALDYVATVHHGIEMVELECSAPTGDELVVFGRIHPDKGTADAIEIAERAGRRLVICGIVQDAEYFAERIEPHVDGDRVVYRGSVGPAERADVLTAAAVLLHPIDFDRAVRSVGRGGDGLRHTRGGVSARIDARDHRRRRHRLRRRRCGRGRRPRRRCGGARPARRPSRAASRFDVERMVDGYLEVYDLVLASPRSRT